MKKKYLIALAVVVVFLLFKGCGNGSSGSKMLDLEVRIIPDTDENRFSNRPEEKLFFEKFANLFTVLPGPYEFTWEELKKRDTAVGYEQCSTKLKIRLRRTNLVIKPNPNSEFLTDDESRMKTIIDSYDFALFDSEGNTWLTKVSDFDDENILLRIHPVLDTVWGADGKGSPQKNEDGMRDFYHFLMSEPGTEFDLVLDCLTHPCRLIDDIIEFNKGLNIYISSVDNYKLSASFIIK